MSLCALSYRCSGHDQGRIQEFDFGGPNMASAEREPVRGSGAMPPVRSRDKAPGRGVKGASGRSPPPEADEILALWDCICV